MSRPEHLGDFDTDPQRRSRRDSTLLRVPIRSLDGHASIEANIRNLSEGGMMAENVKLYPLGTRIEVELKSLGWVAGKVVWTVENRMGIAFDQSIDVAEARRPVPKSQGDLIMKRPKPGKPLFG